MKTFWKVVRIVSYIILAALYAWLIISFFDIIADNNRPNPSHYPWNFFVLL